MYDLYPYHVIPMYVCQDLGWFVIVVYIVPHVKTLAYLQSNTNDTCMLNNNDHTPQDK